MVFRSLEFSALLELKKINIWYSEHCKLDKISNAIKYNDLVFHDDP